MTPEYIRLILPYLVRHATIASGPLYSPKPFLLHVGSPLCVPFASRNFLRFLATFRMQLVTQFNAKKILLR